MAPRKRATAVPVHGILPGVAGDVEPIASLVPWPGNPRRHALPKIVESLRTNGQYKAITARASDRRILAGHGTVEGCLELGWTHVAVSWIECDDQAALRIVAVDNKTNDDAGYDDAELVALLAEIIDLEGSGFTADERAALLAQTLPRPSLTDPDDAPSKPANPVTVLGDVWQLGPHRLLCGDSTDVAAVEGMLAGARCTAMWTDPPYGVEYVGGTADKLTIKNDGAAGLTVLLDGALAVASVALRAGAPYYIAHPAGPLSLKFTAALLEAGWGFRQQLVWVKSSLVLGRSDYHYQHEPLLAGVSPGDPEPDEAQHENVVYGFTPDGEGRLGRGGAAWFGDNKQTTVFEVAKPPRSSEHPTMKPVSLITAMLGNSVRPGGLVYDPFAGSGSTLIACHTLGMVARVVELDPKYCDVICRRYQEHTGMLPVLESTGDPVDFTKVREPA
jgi:DNA modification methylase